MLFGWPKVEAGRGSGQREAKRKRKRQKSAARKNAAQPKSSRRLDSSMPGIAPPRPAVRPPAPPPVPPRPPAAPPAAAAGAWPPPKRRGAPLAPLTRWLLEKMSQLHNINDYMVFKDEYVERYCRDPNHSRADANRAFYNAVGVCLRYLSR